MAVLDLVAAAARTWIVVAGRGQPVSQSGVLLRHTCHHVGRRALEAHRVVDVLKELPMAGVQSVEAGLALGRGAEAISVRSAERGRTAPPQTNHNQARLHHEPHMGQTLVGPSCISRNCGAHVAYSF